MFIYNLNKKTAKKIKILEDNFNKKIAECCKQNKKEKEKTKQQPKEKL